MFSSGMASRQSTLQDSLLLAQSESDGAPHDGINVSFERDFVDEGPLGSGQFADVFKVRPSVGSSLPASEGQQFAIKRSRSEMRSKKEREWLLHEVKIMKRVGARPSPYLVRLVRAWQEGGFFFMQLTLAEKGSVKDLLVDLSMQGKVLTDSTAWHIFHNAVSGLQHIHACGIVHNDIKPANLLITSSGVVQIGDFGIALEHGKYEDGREGDARFVASLSLSLSLSLSFFLSRVLTPSNHDTTTTLHPPQVHGARGAKYAWQDAQRRHLFPGHLPVRGVSAAAAPASHSPAHGLGPAALPQRARERGLAAALGGSGVAQPALRQGGTAVWTAPHALPDHCCLHGAAA